MGQFKQEIVAHQTQMPNYDLYISQVESTLHRRQADTAKPMLLSEIQSSMQKYAIPHAVQVEDPFAVIKTAPNVLKLIWHYVKRQWQVQLINGDSSSGASSCESHDSDAS